MQQGFNRSFCGKHNTLYGKGVYFARDASYSTYPLYCTPDARDIQTVFLVRVVVGEYCKGYKHAVTPDVRNVAKNQLYDSTVDNVLSQCRRHRRVSVFRRFPGTPCRACLMASL